MHADLDRHAVSVEPAIRKAALATSVVRPSRQSTKTERGERDPGHRNPGLGDAIA